MINADISMLVDKKKTSLKTTFEKLFNKHFLYFNSKYFVFINKSVTCIIC